MSKSEEISKSEDVAFTIGCGIVAALLGLVFIFAGLDSIYSGLESLGQEEPPWPEGVPSGVPQLPADGCIDQQAYLVPYDRESEVTVCFAEKWSFKGLWSGSNATFIISAPYTADLVARTHSASWGKLLVSSGSDDTRFAPWLAVTFSMEKEYYHQWIYAIAGLRVVYPATSGPLTFVNESDHLERGIRFFVVSPDEDQMVAQHREWEQAQEYSVWQDVPLFLYPLLFVVGAGALLMEGLRKIRQR